MMKVLYRQRKILEHCLKTSPYENSACPRAPRALSVSTAWCKALHRFSASGETPPFSSVSPALLWAFLCHINIPCLRVESLSIYGISLNHGGIFLLAIPMSAIFHYSLANINQGPIGYEAVKGSRYVSRNTIQTVSDKRIHPL